MITHSYTPFNDQKIQSPSDGGGVSDGDQKIQLTSERLPLSDGNKNNSMAKKGGLVIFFGKFQSPQRGAIKKNLVIATLATKLFWLS
jgi:hypothetical protein